MGRLGIQPHRVWFQSRRFKPLHVSTRGRVSALRKKLTITLSGGMSNTCEYLLRAGRGTNALIWEVSFLNKPYGEMSLSPLHR